MMNNSPNTILMKSAKRVAQSNREDFSDVFYNSNHQLSVNKITGEPIHKHISDLGDDTYKTEVSRETTDDE